MRNANTMEQSWSKDPRWKDVTRPYIGEDVAKLRGSIQIEYTLARLGAERLWGLLHNESYVPALGALTGNQAVQQVQAGLKAIYLSGWQVAADANNAGQMYPDQSLYPADSVPNVVRRINNALMRADQIHHLDGKNGTYWMAPIVADAEAGFGGTLNAFELMKAMIEAGASCVHFEDQLSSAKKCGHLGGKVLVPTSEAIQKLVAARLAADVLGVPTLIMARTDADSAHLLTSDIDPRDREFITGERTSEGFFRIRGGLDSAIARGIAYAPYADLIWCETSHPDIEEARRFADAIHAKYPGKLLAYNCSPSFNWKKNLDDHTIANFQRELARMGYKFQFVTLAGFHALNLSMFELARGYKDKGMTAYARLQEKEFAREAQYGYQAVKHQRFVGTGYFDALTQVIAAGTASTTALADSTEQEQFSGLKLQVHPKHGPDAGCQPILGECPSLVSEIMPTEESLLPSGD
ncbi:MAG TPA: isocitrate lyase [Candidatus Sulfotelmatobacter sp.]|nr:isocitrate lyase [Candidatus Sulfotelmatobacter sp.]